MIIIGGSLGDLWFFCLLYLRVLFAHICRRERQDIEYIELLPRASFSTHFKEIR